MENNIDDIFKKAIDPLDTEPSQEFWRKAAESVISRTSKANAKRASRWRVIALVLALLLFVLGYFTYKMQTGLNTVEQQVAAIENAKNASAENAIKNSNTHTIDNDASLPIINKNTQAEQKLKNKPTEIKAEKYVKQPFTVQRDYTIANGSTHNNRVGNEIAIDTKQQVPSHKSDEKTVEPVGEKTDTINLIAGSIPVAITKPVEESKGDKKAGNTEYVKTVPALCDSLTLQENKTTSHSSKFSISAFFSPDIMLGYSLKATDSWASQGESSVKSEQQKFSYTTGVKLGYKISSRFTISAGIGYQVYSFDISPCTLYAEKDPGGKIGYSITESSGTVYCPYYANAVGDSLKMHASSTRSYIEIPVQLNGDIISKGKYRVYITAGVEANICAGEQTTMDWEDSWYQTGKAIVTNMEGKENVYFSYHLGAGASYKIAKQFSIYLEPVIKEAITAIDNNTSAIIAYPRQVSFTTGLTYHL